MKPRILLTGPTGQIGAALLRTLPAAGDVLAPGRSGLDLLNAAGVNDAVATLRPQLIVNAAGYTAVDAAEGEPDLAMRVNRDGPRLLAEAADRFGAMLVHYSTDYVFDGTASQPYRPDNATNPLNAYGCSKLAGEAAIAASGADALILRTSWVYSTTRRNFLLSILARAEAGDGLRVVDDQHGCPTPAHVIAAATTTAVVAMLDGAAPAGTEIQHLCCSGITTWHAFAAAILERYGLDTPLEAIGTTDWPTAARRPRYSALDCSGFAARFDTTLPHWRDGLAATEERGRAHERISTDA